MDVVELSDEPSIHEIMA